MSSSLRSIKSRSSSSTSSRTGADVLPVYNPNRVDYSIERLRDHLRAALSPEKFDQIMNAIKAEKDAMLGGIVNYDRYGNMDQYTLAVQKQLKAEPEYAVFKQEKASISKKKEYSSLEKNTLTEALNRLAAANKLVSLSGPSTGGKNVKKEDVVKMIEQAATAIEAGGLRYDVEGQGRVLFQAAIAALLKQYDPSQYNMNALQVVSYTLRREPYRIAMTQVPSKIKEKDTDGKQKAFDFVVTQLKTGSVPSEYMTNKVTAVRDVAGLKKALADAGITSASKLNKYNLDQILGMTKQFIDLKASSKKSEVVKIISDYAGFTGGVVDKDTLMRRYDAYITAINNKEDLEALLDKIRSENTAEDFNMPGAIKVDPMKKLYKPFVDANLISAVLGENKRPKASPSKSEMVAAIFGEKLSDIVKTSRGSKTQQPFSNKANCNSASQMAIDSAVKTYGINTRGKSRAEICDEIFAAYYNTISDKFLDKKKDLTDALAATGLDRQTRVDKLAKRLNIEVPSGRLSDLVYQWMLQHYKGRALTFYPGENADDMVEAFIMSGTIPSGGEEKLAVIFSDVNRGAVNASPSERVGQLQSFYQNFVQRLRSGDTRDFAGNLDSFSFSRTTRGTYAPRTSPLSPRSRSPVRTTSGTTSGRMVDLSGLITPAPRATLPPVKAVTTMPRSRSPQNSSKTSSRKSSTGVISMTDLLGEENLPEEA